ncbi:hypothetical protein [uncultured Thermus sp.]|uniref:hypothetical protein n=1 Tax=uncultured Thermus sp. TaxID=157149 RepID=UPI00262AA571|nr:hypothetical protein [uncultured Thermus sp.]
MAEGLAFRGEDWPKAPVREVGEVYRALVRAFGRSGALGLALEGVRMGPSRPQLRPPWPCTAPPPPFW